MLGQMVKNLLKFQSTPPARGATTARVARSVAFWIFQSTPPARGATGSRKTDLPDEWEISIHAPREGGDECRLAWKKMQDISIHAPREGGDRWRGFGRSVKALFQSTPPARGAPGW